MGRGNVEKNESERRLFNLSYKPGGLVCSYYSEMGHSKQKCYEIIGYPDWWDFTKKSRKNIGKSVANTTETDQVHPTTNVVYPGIIGKKICTFCYY